MNRLTVLILAGLMALGIAAPTASAKSISGTPGNDILRGTPGPDTIRTHGGNDVVYGGSGNDIIETGDGRDIARGQSGDDEVIGGNDEDFLYGGAGRDGVDGEGGRDVLHTTDGTSDNDSANGGSGADICHGDRGDLNGSCSSGDGSDGGGGNTPGGPRPNGEDTSSGRCRLVGRITFADPVGFAPEETTFTDRAEGLCTGFVNGVYMANERTLLRGAGGGLLSCTANRVTDPGTLTFTRNTATRSDDVEVDYIAQSQGLFGQIVSRVRGRVSGESIGTVNFRGDETVLRECGGGTSRGGMYDTVGQTVTPLVG